jgi:hypothetical protein
MHFYTSQWHPRARHDRVANCIIDKLKYLRNIEDQFKDPSASSIFVAALSSRAKGDLSSKVNKTKKYAVLMQKLNDLIAANK